MNEKKRKLSEIIIMNEMSYKDKVCFSHVLQFRTIIQNIPPGPFIPDFLTN